MSSHRILYVGHNLTLFMSLQKILGDCRIVRSPGDSTVRTLIAGINYSLLLFDEELPGMTGLELAEFSCSLGREVFTPFIIIKKTGGFEPAASATMQIFNQSL